MKTESPQVSHPREESKRTSRRFLLLTALLLCVGGAALWLAWQDFFSPCGALSKGLETRLIAPETAQPGQPLQKEGKSKPLGSVSDACLRELNRVLNKPENQQAVNKMLADPKFVNVFNQIAGSVSDTNQPGRLDLAGDAELAKLLDSTNSSWGAKEMAGLYRIVAKRVISSSLRGAMASPARTSLPTQPGGSENQESRQPPVQIPDAEIAALKTNIINCLSMMEAGDWAGQPGGTAQQTKPQNAPAFQEIIDSPVGTSLLRAAVQILSNMGGGCTNTAGRTYLDDLMKSIAP